jgi:hypothetical protein
MRLTEDENVIFKKRMRDADIKNMDAYLRKMALTGYILRLDTSEVRETLRLLGNATANINQIAARANESRSIFASDMIELQEEIYNIRSEVSDIMKVFSKVRRLMELHNEK